jgi:hypothetical protein
MRSFGLMRIRMSGRGAEEIPSICEAADMPVIRATQVLESLAKKARGPTEIDYSRRAREVGADGLRARRPAKRTWPELA